MTRVVVRAFLLENDAKAELGILTAESPVGDLHYKPIGPGLLKCKSASWQNKASLEECNDEASRENQEIFLVIVQSDP